jgi:sec-independent protein translocase protein TatA
MHYHNLLFISMTEILFIAFIAFLLFGTKKLPEVAKGLGKGYREFQKAADEIKSEISKVTDDIKDEVNKSTSNIKDEVNKVADDIKNDTKEPGNRAG